MKADDIIAFCLYLMQKSSGGGGGGGGRGKQKFEQDPHNWIVEWREEQWSNIHDLSDKKSVH